METSLLAFTEHFFRARYGSEFIINHHHQKIAAALEAVERGEIKNLLINMPPRYGKTELAVINWMARCVARNPAAKFIHLSYSSDLALDNSTKVRELVKSEEFQQYWPVTIKPDSDSKQKWYTAQGGGMYATMAGGAIIGFGAGAVTPSGLFDGAIVIDDPLKADDARSDVERGKVNERLLTTIQSRRNSPENTPIIIIMQRLHEDDMSGFVLAGKLGESFHHLCLPACNEDTQEPLWPHMHSYERLMQLKAADPYIFAGQYQQHPVPHGGGMIKTAWFRRYAHQPAQPTRIVQSWDTANKAGELNDYSVCTTWMEYGGVYYLVDLYRERLEYPDLKRMVVSLKAKWNPHAVLIEDKASGQQLIQDLRRDGGMPILAIEPEKDKETRASACSAMIEAGMVHLPESASWLADFETEIMHFPNSKHKDQVDSVTQFLNWMRTRGGSAFQQLMDELYPDG